MCATVYSARTSQAERLVTEESVNQWTHGAGLLLAVVGASQLVPAALRQGDLWQQVGCCVYAATLVALYAASTLSHSFLDLRRRHFFRTVDQVCIFLLIAGTFTPFGLVFLRTGPLVWLTVAVWVLALVGICFKVFVRGLQNVAISAYVMLGWLPTISWNEIATCIPAPALAWLIAGGLLYTLGTLFLATDERVPYFHGVWHLLVMAASACHFLAIYNHCIPWTG